MFKFISNAVSEIINQFKSRWIKFRCLLNNFISKYIKYLKELDRTQVIGLGLVLVGIFLASFPYIQNVYYQRIQRAEVEQLLEQQSVNSSETKHEFDEPLSVFYRDHEDYQSIADMQNEIEDPVLESENEFGVTGNFAYELAEEEGVIEIPTIDLQLPVGYGVTLEDLAVGPGFYPESAPPEEGNVSIAGHRTTYGAPFNQLGELEQGDEIVLHYQGTEHRYEVTEIFDTESNDWTVIENTPSPKITLTTCHPPGSSERRLIVRGTLKN